MIVKQYLMAFETIGTIFRRAFTKHSQRIHKASTAFAKHSSSITEHSQRIHRALTQHSPSTNHSPNYPSEAPGNHQTTPQRLQDIAQIPFRGPRNLQCAPQWPQEITELPFRNLFSNCMSTQTPEVQAVSV